MYKPEIGDIVRDNGYLTVTILEFAEKMSVILNSCEVTPICAGRLVDALNVAVSEILED